jgi:hypothetical protein
VSDDGQLDVAAIVLDQLDGHWQYLLRPRLEGLTDDEYLWEPVAGCWSLRRRAYAVTAHAVGAADVVMDLQFPEPAPAPVTTIAWRMGHVAVGCFATRAANQFGSGGVGLGTIDWPLTAAGGLALLDESYAAWIDGLRSLEPEDFSRPTGPSEGAFADAPLAGLVTHVSREVIHHGAEICLLRDLYAARPFIE